jgi:two-component system LytT family response regulator
MKPIKAVIIEDSRLARNELKKLILEYDEIELIGEAENVDTGFLLINDTKPDLIFLDIQMPEKNGFELLEMLDEIPTIVFTTAFDEYAIKSFDYNAFDYLLKPINPKRFSKTILKITENHQKKVAKETLTNHLYTDRKIFLREGEKCWLVKIKKITLLEIVGNYTRVFFENKSPLIYKSLIQIEEKLPNEIFFRANRQQIININHIKEIVTWFNGKLKIELKSGKEIEVSRRQSYIFKERLSF